MALHLNFYHEIQKDAQVRARDPIKLAGFAAAGVALLLLGYYFYRSSAISEVSSAYAAQNAEWRKLEPQLKTAALNEKVLLAQRAKNAQLIERLDGRFYWASLLEQISANTPEVIQITGFDGRIVDGSVTLAITALSAGEQPRLVAEQFRSGLESKLSEIYQNTLVRFDGNSLEEIGRNVEIHGKSLAMARFNIRVTFKVPKAPTKAEAGETKTAEVKK